MEHCENCGNLYGKAFKILISGQTHIFDCFECAIQRLAPQCNNCGTKIIGHGVEAAEMTFCSAHCARQVGFTQLTDHSRELGSITIK